MNTGDIITASIPLLPGIYHQGIIVDTGDQKLVYHNTPTARNDAGGNMIVEPLESWIRSRRIVDVQPTGLNADQIRSRSMQFQDKPFNLFTWNCEHFINGILGSSGSKQLRIWTIAALATWAVYKLR